MPIARVNLRPRSLVTRVPPSTGLQVGLAIAAKKGPTEPSLGTGQTDFLRRYTADGRNIPVDADDGHWSAWTYFGKGDRAWINRVFGRSNPTQATGDDVDDASYAGVRLGASAITGMVTALSGSPTLKQGTGTGATALTDLNHDPLVDRAHSSVTSAANLAALTGAIAFVTPDSSHNPKTKAGQTGFFSAQTNTASDHTPQQVVLLHAANPGAWGNKLAVEILAADGKVADTAAGQVRELVIYRDGSEVDRLMVSRTKGLKDARGNALYIEDALSGNEYIRAVDSGAAATVYIGLTNDIDVDAGDTLPTGYTRVGPAAENREAVNLGGGNDGTTPVAADYSRAYDAFTNKNIYPDIKLLLDGGMTDSGGVVGAKLGTMAASRVSSQAILNLPERAFDSEGWATGSGGSAATNASTYLATGVPKTKYATYFGPRVSYTDEFNRREITIPVDGIFAGNASVAYREGRQYDAVAGPELGVIDEALDVAYRLSDADLDILYDTLRVNPIRYERGYDISFWGNRTAEAIPTDEGEMHVRFMMMDIGPRLVRALLRHIYRRNDPAERALVWTLVDTFMQRVQREFGVYRYQVVCDHTNNTVAEEEQNRMIVWLFIWVTRVSEQIDLYPILTPRSVTLADAQLALAA